MIGQIVRVVDMVADTNAEYLVHLTSMDDAGIRGDYALPKTNFSSEGAIGRFFWNCVKSIQVIDPTPEQKQLFPHLREKFPKWFKNKSNHNVMYLRFDSMDSRAIRFDKNGKVIESEWLTAKYKGFNTTNSFCMNFWEEIDAEPDVVKNHKKEQWYRRSALYAISEPVYACVIDSKSIGYDRFGSQHIDWLVNNLNDSRYWEPTDKPQVVIDYDGQLWYKRNVVEGTVPKYISVIAGGQAGWDSCGQMIGTYIGKEKWNIEDKNLWTQIFKPECIKC